MVMTVVAANGVQRLGASSYKVGRHRRDLSSKDAQRA